MLGDHFTSPVFTAALELWVAARTDPALLAEVAPLEQQVGRETHRMTVELLGADEAVRAEQTPPAHRPAEVRWREEADGGAPRGKLDLLLSLKLAEATKGERSLEDVMQEVSRRAQKRGLTPEVLQALLDE